MQTEPPIAARQALQREVLSAKKPSSLPDNVKVTQLPRQLSASPIRITFLPHFGQERAAYFA